MFFKKFLLVLLIFCIQNCFALSKLYEEVIVTVNLNFEEQKSSIVILRDTSGNIFIPKEDMYLFNIQNQYLTSDSLTLIENKSYFNLGLIAGLNYQYDPLKLILKINTLPYMMKEQLQTVKKTPISSELFKDISSGLFMNYNLNLIHNFHKKHHYHNNRHNHHHRKVIFSGFHELTYFSDLGVVSNTLLVSPRIRDHWYGHRHNKSNKDDYQVRRLETNWTYEDPNNITYYRIGDSVTKPALWSAASRFLGIQYSTNLSLRPDIIPHPLLNINYNVALPGSIELYNNSRKIYNSEAHSGPLGIHNIPVVTGRGELELKVTDITGQIQKVQIPYYIAPELLAEGMQNISYSIGTQRIDYGFKNNKYDSFLTNFDHIYGVNNYYTVGAHFESRDRFATAGITNSIQVGNLGALSYSLASNLDHFKQAQLMALGYNYKSTNFNIGFNVRKNWKYYYNIHDYRFMPLSDKPSYQFVIGYNARDYGSISLNFITYSAIHHRLHHKHKLHHVKSYSNYKRRRYKDHSYLRNRLVALTYSKRILKNGIFNCTFGKNLDGKRDSYVYLSFMLNLGHSNYQVSTNQRRKYQDYELNISSPASKPLDYGYQARFMRHGKHNGMQLRLEDSSRYTKSNVEWYQFSHNKHIKGSVSGSVIFFDNDLFFARPINNSFALVQTPYIPHATIYSNNQISGCTNSKGKLLVPELIPYVPVEFRIHPKDIPFDVRTETINVKTAVKNKVGALVKFKTSKVKALEATLVNSKGSYIGTNSEVRINNIKDVLLVGFEGKLYIDNIGEASELTGCVITDDKTCNFKISVEQNDKDPIIDVGKVICH